jgi:hypothetical protein
MTAHVDIDVRTMAPTDAAGLAACIGRCYEVRQTDDVDRGLERLVVEHIGEDLADLVLSTTSATNATLIMWTSR